MNLIRREGAEVHTANAAFTAGNVAVAAGDYIVRLDQPYGAIVETLLGVQFYPPENPRPYDDTGWAIPLLRNVKATRDRRQGDPAAADDARRRADFEVPGTISGTGPVLIVDHTTDNTLVTFRFQHAGVKMSAAEQAFEAGGHKFAPGAFVIAERESRGARAVDQGARALGVGGRRRAVGADARPRRAAHRLHPHLDQHAGRRLGPHGARQVQGALHLLRRQPGAAGQPASEVRRDRLPARRRHGRPAWSTAACRATSRGPYKKTDDDAAPRHPGLDRRHARRPRLRRPAGADKFVQEGGVLITEGGTSTIFPSST